jgi:hypothetical protein
MDQCCHSHNDKTCSCPVCQSSGSCPVCHPKGVCGENHSEESHPFLEIADSAWMEVLKDKIKEHILATQNDRMTELAKIISETNNNRWKNKMEKKHGCAEFKEKLHQFFAKFKK